MNFIYILTGYEGTTHNGRVLTTSMLEGFKALKEYYYLTNAGYSNSSLTLVPYRGVRYYLRE